MRNRPFASIGLLLALMLTLLPMAGGNGQRVAAAQSDAGLGRNNTYVSPQFDYTVEWDDDWSARARDVTSNRGGFDTLTLRGAGGTLRIAGQADEVTAAEVVQKRIGLESDSEADIVRQDLEAAVPTALLQVGRNTVLIEGHTLAEHGAVLLIVLSARENRFDDALASAQAQVLVNDRPILTGAAVDGDDPVPTPDATTTPVAESNISGSTFTSQLYGYSFTWDTAIWEVSDEFLNDASDGAVFDTDTGALTVWSWNGYGDDPVACLDGESGYYANEDPAVTGWEPAEGANGEPIREEGADYAYGVFRLTYTNPNVEDAEPVDLVDYIECRAIPGQDAVLVIFGSAAPDVYNDHLDRVLDVADTLAFDGRTTRQEADKTPPATEKLPATGLAGSTFTSPSFGYMLEIPSGWTVGDEVLSRNDERLMLTNGVSDVTLWATDAYSGTLEGCIGFVAQSVTFDEFALDVTADGDPFRGSDANGAYANFVYSGDAGEKRAFFVACRYIDEGESLLILTQDVAYEDYTSQRQARRALQDAIELP